MINKIKETVVISDGNTKIGKIPNISLPPEFSCKPNVPCVNDCYSIKTWRQYPNVREAWFKNYRSFLKDENDYFLNINDWINIKNPRLFRWHVSGDMPCESYFNGVRFVARYNPDVRFLIFTKCYDMVNNCSVIIPPNLSVVLSAWPDYELPVYTRYPIAWMQDGTEDRIPDDAEECHGYCEECEMCWVLKTTGKDIYFKKH